MTSMSSLVVFGCMNMVDISCLLKFFMQKDVHSCSFWRGTKFILVEYGE